MSDKPPHLMPPPLPPHPSQPQQHQPAQLPQNPPQSPPQNPVGAVAPRPPRFDDVRPGLESGPGSSGRPGLPRQGTPLQTTPPHRQPTARAPTQRPPTQRPPTQRPVPPGTGGRPPVARGAPNSWPSSSQPKRRGWSVLGIVGTAVLGLGVLVAAGAAALLFAPPVAFLKAQAVAEIKSRTGRDLTIDGPVTFKVFPAFALRLEGVTLSGPAEMGPGPFAIAKSVEARVKLWPLLSRRVSVDQLILTEPVFDLRVDAAGRRSWDFAAPTKAASVGGRVVAQAAPAKSGLPDTMKDFIDNASNPDNPSPSTGARLAALDDLTLGDVRIQGGTVHYADEGRGIDEAATAIDAKITLTALQNPLETTGTLTWNAQAIGFDMKLASPRALLEDRPARLKLAIKAAPVDARFEGSLTARAGIELDGELSAKGASLRGLAQWLGTELPAADGFGAHSIEAKLKAGPRNVMLFDANATLDGATVTGTIGADLSAIRPKISGNLKVSYLDLNRYTLAAAQPLAKPEVAKPAMARPAVARPQAMSPPGGGVTKPKSIEDLIDTVTGQSGAGAGPKVKGYSAREGWSSQPIQMAALGATDADVRLATGGLRWRDIKTGAATVTVSLKSKVLKVNLDEVEFYDGKGRGVVTIDASQAVPVVGANLSADGVSGAPLLKDAAGFDRISGKAKLQIAVGARGFSELEIVETLTGKAEFSFANGAIKGVNVGGALKALQQSRIPNFKDSPTEATDFSELVATFAIDRGIATNTDLAMFSPLLRIGGAGQIALPQRTIDYVVRPRIVASAQGQGAADRASGEKLAGLEIPLKIRGPLADPKIEPDFNAILKDPNKAIEAAKELVKPFKGAGGLLKSLIGKDSTQPSPGDPPAPTGAPQKIDPKKLLDGLLAR